MEKNIITLSQAVRMVSENGKNVVAAANFDDFDNFMLYFDNHYKPLLQAIKDGEEIDQQKRHLLNFLADDLLSIFQEEVTEETNGDKMSVVVITFADVDNFHHGQEFFDSKGDSSFWASSWDEEKLQIELAESCSLDMMERMIRKELAEEGFTNYSLQGHVEDVPE